MKPVNKLLTILSLTAVVITLERVSPTTRILLPPYQFLRLHEVVQMGMISAFSVIVSFLLLRVITGNFALLRDPTGTMLGILFILGTYYYATGNGAHEIASFLFNQYCDPKHFTSAVCKSAYVDDYYFGNIVYFVGLGVSNLALILLERRRPDTSYSRRDMGVTLINAAVLAITFIAYDAFDVVLVGLLSTFIFAVVYDLILLRGRTPYRALPFTLYSAAGFTLATVVAIPVRIVTSL